MVNMNSQLSHVQVNIDSKNIAFYKDLFAFLGWTTIMDSEEMIGLSSGEGASVWFLKRQKDIDNDYDGTGMNHLGIGVSSVENVDAVVAYINEKGISPLFDTPRHRPDFTGEKGTYYQVMFESPDKILFEVVFTTF